MGFSSFICGKLNIKEVKEKSFKCTEEMQCSNGKVWGTQSQWHREAQWLAEAPEGHMVDRDLTAK